MVMLWILLAACLAVILQTTLLPAVVAAGSAPDLVFLLVVFFSLQRRSTLGVWAAFGIGLAQDVAAGVPLGLNASILLGVAYVGGLLRTKLFKENVTTQIFIVLILTFFHQFLMFYWMNTILNAGYPAGNWLKQAMVMSIYHVLLGPLLFKWLAGWIPGEDVYQHLITGRNAESSRFRLRRM